jgi:hypothetical protein
LSCRLSTCPHVQIGSTILAQAAWSGSDVAISFEECKGDIPQDIYNKVSSPGAHKQPAHWACMPWCALRHPASTPCSQHSSNAHRAARMLMTTVLMLPAQQ